MHNKILLGLALFLCAFSLNAQSEYYYNDEGRIALAPNLTTYIVVGPAQQLSLMEAAAESAQVKSAEAFIHKGYGVATFDGPLQESEALAALGLDASQVQLSPGYMYPDGFTVYPTQQIVFRPSLKDNVGALQLSLAKYSYTGFMEKYGVYRIRLSNLGEAFAAANELYESGLAEFAHPDFYAPKKKYNDPLFNQQFQMHNTGQTIDGVQGVADMDCNALEAWGVTLGSSSTLVAVIDDGLEFHEDFTDANGNSRVLGGFTPAINGGNGTPTSSGAHGVSCAGSIGASHNGIGVMGVAPLVQMISVNIFYGGESTQDIADGITWAKNQGADVLSNSWGYGSCFSGFSNINNALADATNNGRGGLGCVIAFASGNDYQNCVSYPANNSNVIAVGAFTNQGVRSSYSNYGPTLDIMAPSNAVGGQPGAGVRTTDRMGSPGYGSGNYTGGFGGTSSACPVVAGVAALVLGYNPALTQAQVKNILYSTAIDMGPAGVDNEYANGRVNAYGALLAAGGTPATCDDGIQNGQETGVDCGGPDCPSCPSNCNGTEATLTIVLDNYPEETTWSITNDATGATVASGGAYGNFPDGSTVSEDICLADGCYTFTIFDSYGDGICCAYGSGSYSLSGGGNTLASGGAFGSSEATPFCIGGGGADTQAPTVPGNLTASNTTQTTTDLSWTASSDNVGVTGYNIYQGGTLLGSTTATNTGITGLTASTTYTFAVSAVDDAGNESGTATVSVTTLDEPTGGGSDVLFGSFFETGLDGWQDGGSDCARVRSSASYEGQFSMRLRDNSGTASSMTSSAYNLSGYNSVELEFYFYPNSMENGEDFFVRYNDGSGWQTVATYASGSSFSNGQFYVATVTLDAANFNLGSNARFRFQCDASTNSDQVYIDAITLTGFSASGNSLPGTGARSTITPLPSLTNFGNELSSLGEADVLLQPNPASDFLTVQSYDAIEEIRLFTVDGKQLLQRRYDAAEQAEINVAALPAGMYFLSITTEEETFTEQFVIKR